jgi:hypothetical protein
LVIVLCFGLTLAACGKQQVSYPIDSNVSTTLQKTIALGITASGSPIELSSISQYSKYGYGAWTYGAGLPITNKKTGAMLPFSCLLLSIKPLFGASPGTQLSSETHR